uniref:Uncharacterized protein n=1 Tax=Globodera rostochiensis TaxID=31243 RepID=A0A914HXG7_GLORO
MQQMKKQPHNLGNFRSAHLEISSILSIDGMMLKACHNIELMEVGYAFPDFTTTGTPEGSILNELRYATRPANFIICIYNMGAEFLEPNIDGTSNAEFLMLNFQTAEKLVFERCNEDYWQLVRCPMSRDESDWDELENKQLSGSRRVKRNW